MKTPDEIKHLSDDWQNQSWQTYSIQELGEWVHLLYKRSKNRKNPEKRKKDLKDARNYWKMMGAWLDDAEKV